MALLLDVFGRLSVLLHGARLAAQSFTLGGIVFMAALASELGAGGVLILRRSRMLLGASAAALALVEALILAAQGTVLVDSIALAPVDLPGAGFVLSGAAIVAALAIAARRHPAVALS